MTRLFTSDRAHHRCHGTKPGMAVIAEGVKTEEQRQLLQKYGCSNVQGYLFVRPVPIKQFEALIKQG